jgi:hypothetical protein
VARSGSVSRGLDGVGAAKQVQWVSERCTEEWLGVAAWQHCVEAPAGVGKSAAGDQRWWWSGLAPTFWGSSVTRHTILTLIDARGGGCCERNNT